MANPLVSKKTRNELCEYFVDTTLREIATEFDNVDIDCDLEFVPTLSGQRRTLVHQYYHSIDWTKWSDVRKFIQLYENVLNDLELKAENENYGDWVTTALTSLTKWIEKDGYQYSNGRLSPVSTEITDLSDLSGVVQQFDIPELEKQIKRARDAVNDDPGLAIGTAKELLETTCKTILSEHSIEYDENWEITKLVKETRKQLGLVPESIPSASKGSDSIQRILSSLGSVAQGVAELRNLYGTGHGKHGRVIGVSPRHARLAVGSAATLASFLLETHQDRILL